MFMLFGFFFWAALIGPEETFHLFRHFGGGLLFVAAAAATIVVAAAIPAATFVVAAKTFGVRLK